MFFSFFHYFCQYIFALHCKKNNININEHLHISYALSLSTCISNVFCQNYFIRLSCLFFAASPMDCAQLYTCQMQHFFTTEYSEKTWEFAKGKGLLRFHKTMIEQMLAWNSCKIICNICLMESNNTCPLYAIISHFYYYLILLYIVHF